MRSIFLPFLLFLNSLPSIAVKLTIKGQLLCHGKPQKGLRVWFQLEDYLNSKTLSSTRSKTDGTFEITAKYEYSTYFNVEHFCDQKLAEINKIYTRVNDGCLVIRTTPTEILRRRLGIGRDVVNADLKEIELGNNTGEDNMCMSDLRVQKNEIFSLTKGIRSEVRNSAITYRSNDTTFASDIFNDE